MSFTFPYAFLSCHTFLSVFKYSNRLAGSASHLARYFLCFSVSDSGMTKKKLSKNNVYYFIHARINVQQYMHYDFRDSIIINSIGLFNMSFTDFSQIYFLIMLKIYRTFPRRCVILSHTHLMYRDLQPKN